MGMPEHDEGGRTAQAMPGRAFFSAGVGMSAGGLEALGPLLAHATLDRIALIVVQHLAPAHESVLPALLSKSTSVPVLLAEDGMRIAPRHVYVIPPNADLAILDGVLQVMTPPTTTVPRLPIDFFLRSLADDQADRAIGIVLSGTGSDGTAGLLAVRAAGGLTFVQEPASAKYDGMPRQALEAGAADAGLTPEAIARALNALGKHPHSGRLHHPRPEESRGIAKILVLIRSAFGTDLSLYKPSTTERRIARRMAVHGLESVDDYVRLLQENAVELRVLYKDILIGVTRFFRDGTPFEVLKADILPRIVDKKPLGAPLRIWVAACSTGEEAYSVAICLLEYLGERTQDYAIQVFGTDIDEDSIQRARRGVYPKSIEADVSSERLRRFFTKKDDTYQISRQVRDMVVFSVQNVARDAPFSKLDLVSCRNLLIYLQAPLQKKVLRVLHYALNPNAFLLLGCSETIGDLPELFSLVDRKNKVYSAKPVSASHLGPSLEARAYDEGRNPPPQRAARTGVNLASLADRKILEMYGPPAVVVSETFDVLHFRGSTSPYLEPASGAASLNILRLIRSELHIDLRKTLQRALDENRAASIESKIAADARIRRVKISVLPMTDPDSKARVLLVVFHELPALDAPAPDPVLPPRTPREQHVLEVEHELLVTKEYLQRTIEEAESTNEELKSANEELQSANEELQSTNEELETSKEELQSANEELTTVNDELQARMVEQQQINDDLHNVLVGVDNAVIIVGMDLRIRRYTAAAERLFNLVSGDIGRSVALLDAFTGRRLEALATGVIDSLTPVNEEILCADQRWRALRVAPYKTAEHSIRGAVFVLTDVDARKRSEQIGHDVADYAASFLAVVGHPLMIIDARRRVQWANDEYYRRYQVVPEETLGAVFSFADAQHSDSAFSRAVDDAIALGTPFRNLRVSHRGNAGAEATTVAVSGSRMPPGTRESVLVLLSFEDAS
jgi:two-component system CheB/CheR fusion protein